MVKLYIKNSIYKIFRLNFYNSTNIFLILNVIGVKKKTPFFLKLKRDKLLNMLEKENIT